MGKPRAAPVVAHLLAQDCLVQDFKGFGKKRGQSDEWQVDCTASWDRLALSTLRLGYG
jgi:hypothetical protein